MVLLDKLPGAANKSSLKMKILKNNNNFWNYCDTGKKFTYSSTDDAVREDVFCFFCKIPCNPAVNSNRLQAESERSTTTWLKTKTLRNEMKFTV
jgi:hypothetical protein